MKKLLFTAIYTSCLFFNLNSIQAQESEWECINSNSQTDYLRKQFDEVMKTSPLSQELYKNPLLGPKAKTEADALLAKPCAGCLAGKLKVPTEDIKSLAQFVQSGAGISLACIKAARMFSTSTAELKCPDNVVVKSKAITEGKGKTYKILEASGACMTLPMLDYQRQVFENFYRCIRRHSTAPFNPATIFEIIARESTFKPNYSSVAGHGSGQLTSSFVDDVQQDWRGRPTLESIAKDNDPTCAAAKQLAEGDLSKTFKLPKDRCEFIQYGSGMERNALWMMVGLDTTWRKNITPSYTRYINKYKDHPDLSKVMEKMLQLSYGRSGLKGMHAMMSRLGHFPPDRILKELKNRMPIDAENPDSESLTAYIHEIAQRQSQMTKYVDDPGLKAKFAEQGASACIQ